MMKEVIHYGYWLITSTNHVLVGSGVPTDATTPNNVETCCRDPYSCFLRVVSRASKPDGILACLQFGSPGQKYRIIILKEW